MVAVPLFPESIKFIISLVYLVVTVFLFITAPMMYIAKEKYVRSTPLITFATIDGDYKIFSYIVVGLFGIRRDYGMLKTIKIYSPTISRDGRFGPSEHNHIVICFTDRSRDHLL